MPNANQLRMIFAGSGQGASSKQGLAKLFHGGGLRLPLRHDRLLKVEEADPEFEAKSLWALCAIKASSQDAPAPLDERAAARKLGLQDGSQEGLPCELPSGYYELTASEPPQIAAAYLPRLNGGPDSKGQWAQALELKSLAKLVAPSTMACHARFDTEAFAAARDPFADYMTIGQGLGPDERKAERAATKDLAMKTLGLSIWTELPNGREAFGYPAVARLAGASTGLGAASARGAKALLTPDGSVVATTKQLLGLPIYNHDGCSEINNARDIREVREREAARGDIVDSMSDLMMAQAAILNGSRDSALEFDAVGDEDKKHLRAEAAGFELKKFGKERQLFIGQGKSAVHKSSGKDGDECLIVSMDMALVDGQHSSRDYALIALGCAEPMASSGPQYWDEPVPDCSPKQLSERAFKRAKSRYAELEGQPDADRDPLGLGFAQIAQARAKHGEAAAQKLEAASEALCFEKFKAFAPAIPVQVKVCAISDPGMARMFVRMENTTAPQSLAAQSIAFHYNEVQSVVADFNRGAVLCGDPNRLTAIKSLHSNPDFSQVDQPTQLTREFEEVYPFLKAVSDSQGTRGAQTAYLTKNGAYERVRNAAKWEALAILQSEGHIVQERGDEIFEALQERVCGLLLSADALKQRSFEMSPKRVGPTLEALSFPAKVSSGLAAFTKLAIAITQRVFGAASGTGPSPLSASLNAGETEDQRAARVYGLARAAMDLKDALRTEKRSSNGVLSGLMTDSTLDNVMLTMLLNQYSMDVHEIKNGTRKKEARHPASPQAVKDLACARERLEWHAENAPAAFNKAREHLKAEIDALGENLGVSDPFPSRGSISDAVRAKAMESSLFMNMPQEKRRMIIDAAPGPGLALGQFGKIAAPPSIGKSKAESKANPDDGAPRAQSAGKAARPLS